ncbi:hypothetical protein Taro_055240, partial [Colocasia esculenta]|nr:hypothetical protein [Colocasia esculenta]
VTRAFFFPHFLLSSSPTFTFVPLHYFRQSTRARGKAVMRAAAANLAGNDGLEGGIRGKLLGGSVNDLKWYEQNNMKRTGNSKMTTFLFR